MPITRYALAAAVLALLLPLAGCDATETADGAAYALTGHVAAVPQFDGDPELTDLPLGGGEASAANTSCGFGPGEPATKVYLQSGTFATEGERFTLRLTGGRWSDGGEAVLDLSGRAVPGDGTVWELYPDGANQRYLAVFAPEGRSRYPLTLLIPSNLSGAPVPLDGCTALRFSGRAADASWGDTSGSRPLVGVESPFSDEINGFPLVIGGSRYGYTTLNGGTLSLSEDGSYETAFEVETNPTSGGSYTSSSSTSGRYATTGSAVVFDYDLPTLSVGIPTAEGELRVVGSQVAPRLPGRTLLFGD